jgi:hypothetical protein
MCTFAKVFAIFLLLTTFRNTVRNLYKKEQLHMVFCIENTTSTGNYYIYNIIISFYSIKPRPFREGNIIQTQTYRISPIVDFMNSKSTLNMQKYKNNGEQHSPFPSIDYPHTHCTCYVVCSFILHMEGMYNIHTNISISRILILCSLFPQKTIIYL